MIQELQTFTKARFRPTLYYRCYRHCLHIKITQARGMLYNMKHIRYALRPVYSDTLNLTQLNLCRVELS